MLAVDYMVGTDGTKHLLEVNHIPNVTVFPEIRQAYLAGRRTGRIGHDLKRVRSFVNDRTSPLALFSVRS